MKRTVALLAVLVFCICSYFSYAENIDFSQYSDDELISLETSIQAEKISRGMAKSATIYPGKYTIGVHIPAGIYSVMVVEGGVDYFSVRDETGKRIGWHKIGMLSSVSHGIGRLELKDGYEIDFDSVTLVFTVYTGNITFE